MSHRAARLGVCASKSIVAGGLHGGRPQGHLLQSQSAGKVNGEEGPVFQQERDSLSQSGGAGVPGVLWVVWTGEISWMGIVRGGTEGAKVRV